MKLLIVEDQELPREALEYAVNNVMPKFYDGFSKCDYDSAHWYTEAEKLITEKTYDLILLDHLMPYENPGCKDTEDMRKFTNALQDIGYNLIRKIKAKNPKTIVIGTSSLSERELSGSTKPEFTMRKDFIHTENDLEQILAQMKGSIM